MKRIAALIVLSLTLLISSVALAKDDPFEKGVRYYLKKDYARAVQCFKEYVSQKPDAAGYYLLGYASYKLKRFSEAEGYFEEAYLIDPNVSPKEENLMRRPH